MSKASKVRYGLEERGVLQDTRKEAAFDTSSLDILGARKPQRCDLHQSCIQHNILLDESPNAAVL